MMTCVLEKKKKKKKFMFICLKLMKSTRISPSDLFKEEIEYSRNWHWMWSKFYFNQKHYGYINAVLHLLLTYPIS